MRKERREYYLKKAKALFMVTRPPLTIGSTLGALALCKWSGNFSDPYKTFLITFVITAGSLLFNTLNEYHDRHVDRINKPWKPIPSGMVSEEEASAIFVSAAGVLIPSSTVLIIKYGWVYAVLIGVAFLSACVYNLVRRDLIGNAFMAMCYGCTALMSLYPKYPLFALDFALFTFCFNLFVQYQDLEAEKTAKIKTAAIELGKDGILYVTMLLIPGILAATIKMYLETQYTPLLVFATLPLFLTASFYAVMLNNRDLVEWSNRRLARLFLLLFFVICIFY